MLKELKLKNITISDSFWKYYITLINDVVIPYQYQVLNDDLDIEVVSERNDDSLPAGKSHALENFRIAAGISEGEHFGWFFQDSDVYKWLESLSYSLINHPNEKMEAVADGVIDLIAQTQESDGYLNTYFQLKFPKLKYRQLYFSHELYCSGHLIEAGIAYNIATGKDILLNIAIKNVENILNHFGPEDGKIHGADGHQEIELALVKLYEHTQNKKYLELANYFIEVRGQDPDFYNKEILANLTDNLSPENPKVDLDYLQAYIQPKVQFQAKGHAVRMLYMLIGMAKINQYTYDDELLEACKVLWEDIVSRKMYITGAVGGTVHGEAFIGDYDLPNDTMYCETCASIALVNFAYEMFKITKEKHYLDILEQSLYNSVLAGASIDGKHFFYVNPLEVVPSSIQNNPGKGHVKTTRPDWLGCACCPPNFARTIASLGRYIYLDYEDNLYINLFVDSSVKNTEYSITQQTDFPFTNCIKIYYKGKHDHIHIRVPEWAKNFTISGAPYETIHNGFIKVKANGNINFEINFEQPILKIRNNPLVATNISSVAIQRGPFIYCAEEIDNSNHLHLYQLNSQSNSDYESVSVTDKVLKKTLTIHLQAQKINLWKTNKLYQSDTQNNTDTSELTLIPYHLWGNRGDNEMRVWQNSI